MKRLSALLLIVISLLLFCGNQKKIKENSIDKEQQSIAKEKTSGEKPVGKFSGMLLKDLKGNEVTFDEAVQGKLILVDIWDTWCPPCRAEIPGFIELYDEYKDEDVLIVGIALGRKGVPAVEEFIEEYKINYPIFLPANQDQESYFPEARGIPTTYLIDGETGKMLKYHVGFKPKAEFDAWIQDNLK